MEGPREKARSGQAGPGSFGSMLPAEGFAAQLRAELAPPIVNAALTCAAAQEPLKVFGVAPLGLSRQGVLRCGEVFLEEPGPITRFGCRRVFAPHFDRFAKAHKNF